MGTVGTLINRAKKSLKQRLELVYSCEEQWMKPERGLLAGIIIETGLTDNNFKAMEIRPWQKGQGRFIMGGNR